MAKGTKKVNVNQTSNVPTRVGINLINGAQEVYNYLRRDIFGALVASAAKRLNGGEQLTFVVGELKLKNRKTGEMEPARIVQVDPALLDILTKDVDEYQSSRPATLDDAKNALAKAKYDIEKSVENNSGLDLSGPKSALAKAETEFEAMVYGAGSFEKVVTQDFRPIITSAYEAATSAKQMVNAHLLARAEELANKTGKQQKLTEVKASLTENLDANRRALVDYIKLTRAFLAPPAKPTTTKPRNDNGNNGPLVEQMGSAFGYRRNR